MEANMNISPAPASCDCGPSCGESRPLVRIEQAKQALRLEFFTVGWNLIEGIVAVGAALDAGSVAILGFGIDSFVECASALVLIWRLQAERHSTVSAAQLGRIEHRAQRLVAGSLFLLAGYVTFDAITTLLDGERPAFSGLGVALLLVSIVVMQWLARAKRRLAKQLESRALEADAFQTTACWWLSLSALVGVGLNGLLGWWWADPVAAVVIAVFVVFEGKRAWAGQSCC